MKFFNFSNNLNSDIIPDFDTGDLILFSNKKWWFAELIERCTHSILSHIGMIIKDPDFFGEKKSGLFLLESTGLDNITDSEDGEKKFGVQLVPLRVRLKEFSEKEGTIFYRTLECTRNRQFYRRLNKAHSVVHNRSYDIDGLDWVKAKYDIEIGDVQKKNTFFCSALVAFMYVSLGFLPESTAWTLVKPCDFEGRGRGLRFQNCYLMELEALDYT